MLFRIWKTINSYTYDGRMLEFLGELAEIHMDPTASDPQIIKDIPDDAKSEGEGRPNWAQDDLNHEGPWRGIFKDVGIYTDDEWQFIMCKCLAVMGVSILFGYADMQMLSAFYLQRFRSMTLAR